MMMGISEYGHEQLDQSRFTSHFFRHLVVAKEVQV
jgi:hypothetical protein